LETEKDYIDIVKARKRSGCIVCLSDVDVKTITMGRLTNNRSGFDLCSACRVLLHKRLHEEELK